MDNFDPVIEDRQPIDPAFPASMIPVTFLSGGSTLLGTLFIPAGPGSHPVALLLNGFPGNEVNFDIAHMLQRKGIFVLSFNYRGSWGSGGQYSWNNLLDDAHEALRFLREGPLKEKFAVNTENPLLIGYSFGGFSALMNAIRLDFLKNVCAIAPFNAGLMGQVFLFNPEARSFAENKIQSSLGFVNCASAGELVEEMTAHKSDWNLVDHAGILAKKNVLIVGAKYDSTAPLEFNHKPLVQALKSAGAQNLTEYILDTGHSFSDRRIQLMKIISEWITETNFIQKND